MLRGVRETFDPERWGSVSGRLSATIADAHGDAKRTVESASEELRRLLADSFNPDLSTSCTARIGALVRDARAGIDRAFDPSYEGGHLARLTALIEDYFGSDSALGEQVRRELEPANAPREQSRTVGGGDV